MAIPSFRPGIRACLAVLALGAAMPAAAFDMVRFQFDPSVSDSDKTVWQPKLQSAADGWNQIITGYANGVRGNGIVFTVQMQDFGWNGGGILAAAGPDTFFRAGNLTYTKTGTIYINSNPGAAPYIDMQVMMHEMDHGIGFGTLWATNGLYVDGSGKYTGQKALTAYRLEFGQKSAAYVPVELDGGSGTANAHWNQGPNFGLTGILSTETGYKNFQDPNGARLDHPDMAYDLMGGYKQDQGFLSHTTIAELRDLGYTVNETYPNEPAIPVPGIPTGSAGGGAAPIPELRNHPLVGYRLAATEGAYASMNMFSARLDQVFSGRPVLDGAFSEGMVARGGSFGGAQGFQAGPQGQDLSRATAQDDFTVLSEAGEEQSVPQGPQNGFFATAAYTDLSRDPSGGNLGVSATSTDAIFGYDRQIAQDWILGVAFTHHTSSWETSNNQNTSDITAYGAMVYGRWRDVDGMFLGFSGGYRRMTMETENRLPIGAPVTSYAVTNGETHADQFMASVRLGQDFSVAPGCMLTPYAELGLVYSSLAGYTETGAAPLSFEGTTNTNVRATLGLNWAQWLNPESDTSFGYHAGAALRHQVRDGVSTQLASDGFGNQSQVVMLAPSKNSGVFNAGVDFKFKQFSAFVDGNYGFASDAEQKGVSAGVRYVF